MRPLERPSLEAYGFGFITIITAVVPMTPWPRMVLVLIGLGLVADIVWRSRWTINLRHRHKAFILCGIVGLVAFLWFISKSPAQSAPVPQVEGLVSIEFKHTALVRYESSPSVFLQKTLKLRAVYENTGSDHIAKTVSVNGVLRLIASGEGIKEREEEAWKKFRYSWLASLQGSLKEELEAHKETSFDVETDPLTPEEARDLRSGAKYAYFMLPQVSLAWCQP